MPSTPVSRRGPFVQAAGRAWDKKKKVRRCPRGSSRSRESTHVAREQRREWNFDCGIKQDASAMGDGSQMSQVEVERFVTGANDPESPG